MIRITNDVLEKLGINNCYISFPGANAETRLCALTEISRGSPWRARFDRDFAGNDINLHVAVYNGAAEVAARVAAREDGECVIEFDADKSPFLFRDLLYRIADIEADKAFKEKRKDRRYPVGVDGCALFGVDPSRLRLFHKNAESPFMFMDASFSGAKIVAELGVHEIAVGDILGLKVAFSSPVEKVAMRAVARMVDVKADAGGSRKRFAIVGAELVDPPYAWTEKLRLYIERLEG